jgi:hypothetical protein
MGPGGASYFVRTFEGGSVGAGNFGALYAINR